MAKRSIPKNVKEEVIKIIERFDRNNLENLDCNHIPIFKRNYLYIDRRNGVSPSEPICRLKYTGDMKEWVFSIFRYSRMEYDPEEDFFPGNEYVDGTIEGALKAGMRAYHL